MPSNTWSLTSLTTLLKRSLRIHARKFRAENYTTREYCFFFLSNLTDDQVAASSITRFWRDEQLPVLPEPAGPEQFNMKDH